eukprot:TRINITY_DN1288_c0_g1_i1.p1 TRINITY_DN1288_c0_g1~~TRINITY_DN1288_c0_g1_i1.p1  ORF type:complete len:204 (+),score=75.82 TRINITY_DN1288_c0_g1_i1:150-761(+)
MTLQIEPRTEECFFEELSAGQTFELDFEVIRGGLLDIEFKLKSPDQQIVFQRLAFFNHKDDKQNEAEGHVSYVATSTGIHSICFDNTMSRWTAKVVSFFVHDIPNCPSQLPSPNHSNEDVAKLEHLGPVVDSVVRLSDELDAIERMQRHMRVREHVHRDTAESTNSRVAWLSIIESLILISISAFQLIYIRKWFSEADKRRRV